MNAPLAAPLIMLDQAILQQARALSATDCCSMIAALETLLLATPREITAAVGQLFSMRVFDTAEMLAARARFDLLSLPKAMQRHGVILEGVNGKLLAVLADPFDQDLVTWMSSRAGTTFEFVVALAADMQAYLSKQEETVRAVDQLASSDAPSQHSKKSAPNVSFASVNAAASPPVKLVSSTLYDALKSQASDIHLESTPSGLTIKYRVDGVLDHAASIAGVDVAEQVISRLKVLAELDIAERRVPQDGSFRVEASGRDIDLRVSIMPSIHGEDAVIRILDKRAMIEAYGALTLEALGFDAPSLATLRTLAEEPYGMLLVTGPTGSGKTTTLYAALTEIHTGRDKIITIEDPVEYQLPGILQIPVNEKKGLTFAKGLRSILRHDPDKIMVGEIRDRETAEIAVQSALTGHLVLTTVHANNVFDVFGRFSHMGIDPYAFVSALNGIWAQRLIRVNCPHCSQAYQPSAADLARIGRTPDQVVEYRFRRGAGCGDCRGTGYKGRHAVAEILTLTDPLREMIVDKRPISQIKEAARANGTRTLREAALDLVAQGVTTIDEIKRVTLHA